MTNKAINYSYALYADANMIKERISDIQNLLEQGVKVLLFSNEDIKFDDMFDSLSYQQAKLFSQWTLDSNIDEWIEVKDGSDKDGIKQIASYYSQFNIEQYLIEHAPFEENIIVKAGAGTGKTTVMIDRILYLLIKEKVSPDKIVMITFTRDAAKNMYNKLRGLLFNRFRVTGSIEVLHLIEKLNELRIQTIDSFSKDLLREIGSIRGFGLNVKLRSFKMERKKWIEEELDNYFEAELQSMEGTIEGIISPLKIYELVDVLYDFWEKFEQQGFSSRELESVHYGDAPDGNERMNDLIETVLKKVEKRFKTEKTRLSAVSVNDLTRQIDEIREEYGNNIFHNLSAPIDYLFVDEFQDSDDIQIRLISALQEAFQANLFVVGDVKQSIYRFRGALHTAFHLLKGSLNERGVKINDQDYYLTKNYRTISRLLEQESNYFMWWGEKEFLDYSVKDKLTGVDDSEEANDEQDQSLVVLSKREESKENMRPHTLPLIQQRFKQVKAINAAKSDGQEPERMAVLTRTIEEARLVDEWCRASDIPTKLEVGGSYFNSRPVRQFYSLAMALLYPDNAKYLANVVHGPYGKARLLPSELIDERGHRQQSSLLLKENLFFPLDEYVNKLTYQPVLSVLRSIITETKPGNWVFSRKYDELKAKYSDEYSDEAMKHDSALEAKRYDLNLGKLFEMMHQYFSEDFVSLYQITQWLEVNIATNRDEEVDEVEEGDNVIDRVNILTVHRAKGLEYHTVIIPFTERQFVSPFSKIIFDNKKEKVGWLINKLGHEKRQNDYFDDFASNDDTEAIKEETRLLYVAMTRAKKNLAIIRNRKNDMYGGWTWSKLLSNYR